MKNIVTAFVILFIALPAALYIGYSFVPKVRGDTPTGLSDEFLFNSYLILFGFLLTSAAVGPLVARFLEWRSNQEWKAARINARNRLAHFLNNIIDSYRNFLESMRSTNTQQTFAPSLLGETVLYLQEFFDTYESEHAAFNAGMHSAASNIRKELLPLKRALETTQSFAENKRSHKVYIGGGALETLREVYDLPPINSASKLASNPYFIAYKAISLEVEVDQRFEGDIAFIHRFVELNIETIQDEWSRFLKACPYSAGADGTLTEKFEFDAHTQAQLHAIFARLHIKETFLADRVVKKGY